jgi:DNA (cytosine-5)-methyltransferase 1
MDRELPTVTAHGVPTRQAGASPLGMVGATLAPFITYGQQGGAIRPIVEPHHTIAASSKDQNCVAGAQLAPIIVGTGGAAYAGKPKSAGEPLGTVLVDDRRAAVSAFLSTFNGSNSTGGGGEPLEPVKTARAGGQHHAIVCAHMEQANTGRIGHPIAKPISTVTANGAHQRLVETTMVEADALPPAMLERATTVAAFLVKYYGEGGQSQAVDRPIDVVTGKARFAVVTVTIDAVTYVIVDIGLRMLKPRELARAQGFPDDYVLDPECWYLTDAGNAKFGRLPVSHQISAIGNSVCPPMARALVGGNHPGLADLQAAA